MARGKMKDGIEKKNGFQTLGIPAASRKCSTNENLFEKRGAGSRRSLGRNLGGMWNKKIKGRKPGGGKNGGVCFCH